MINNEFIIGFIFGAIITALLGWIWTLYQGWVKTKNAINEPQRIVHLTPKTPAQVQDESSIAGLKLLLLRVIFFVVGWLLVEIGLPEVAALAHDTVKDILQLLLDMYPY